MPIRLAQKSDQEAVVQCVNAAYTKYIARIGRQPAPILADYTRLIARNCVYVLAEHQAIIGVLVMEFALDHVFVENIAILPDQQGRGRGRTLLQFVEQCALEQQLPEIRLYTNELMTENLAFYNRLGFEEVERREDGGYRRVFLRKRL